jgi:hypothetical protein
MTAPYFPIAKTGDGVTTTFDLGFDFLAEADVRVIQNGVLKVRGTDYALQVPSTDSGYYTVRFLTAPTNGHAIKFYRNTPMRVAAGSIEIGHEDAKRALYRSQESGDARKLLRAFIDATALAAGTAESFVAPCDGYIELLRTQVADAAIGTGGAVTVEVDGVAVTGLSITVANSAAVGITQEDTPTTAQSSTTQVRRGQTITVTPAAAFATTGALMVELEVQPADL